MINVNFNFCPRAMNYPIVCPFCGTYWHRGQIEDHKRNCDQK